jgi:hypothetical protein
MDYDWDDWIGIVSRYARAVFRTDDERVAETVAIAWARYWRRGDRTRPILKARWAVLYVLQGRRLACTGRKGVRDAWKGKQAWQGGRMTEVADWRAGPLEEAIFREEAGAGRRHLLKAGQGKSCRAPLPCQGTDAQG